MENRNYNNNNNDNQWRSQQPAQGWNSTSQSDNQQQPIPVQDVVITPPQANQPQQSYGIRDYGAVPVIFDMETMTKMNNSFRTALWTGDYMQITLMSIQPGDDIGIEMHPDTDQFIKVEVGDGIVAIGSSEDNLSFSQAVGDDDAIVIPAGAWHNISNTGDVPLKAYSIYAPPKHPYGTIQNTKADADAAEQD